jgi:hypothetical protein
VLNYREVSSAEQCRSASFQQILRPESVDKAREIIPSDVKIAAMAWPYHSARSMAVLRLACQASSTRNGGTAHTVPAVYDEQYQWYNSKHASPTSSATADVVRCPMTAVVPSMSAYVQPFLIPSKLQMSQRCALVPQPSQEILPPRTVGRRVVTKLMRHHSSMAAKETQLEETPGDYKIAAHAHLLTRSPRNLAAHHAGNCSAIATAEL